MKFSKLMFTFCWIAVWSVPINANTPSKFKTGNVLLQDCTASTGEVAKLVGNAHCLSYIVGVADTHTAMTIIDSTAPLFCVAEGVTPGQMMDIVTGYLKAQPEKRHYMASTLVIMALSQSFPCAK